MGIIPLIFMAAFSYLNTSRIIDEKVNNSIKDNVKIMTRLIDSSISNFVSIVNYISNQDDVKAILIKSDYSSYEERDNVLSSGVN
jgi:two-component system sensor histidine kinase YesM